MQCNGCASTYTYSGAVATELASVITFADLRAWVGSGGSSPSVITPANNTGEGDLAATAMASFMPAGTNAEPWDIQGNPRLNDGTGFSGAYEKTAK